MEERARLPGYREEAVVRHFDAPEAIETRFYEVRAKSILNRVPEASQMPFRWTINVYRGCTHACTYCVQADTPILMADGRHKPISELEVGDAIYGTRVAASGYRHYVRTTVLDKWITIKPAYRLTLEGGTELILSGDHRLLSNRGWKHVLGSPRGQPDRPFLTTRNRLAGTGPHASQPLHDADYRRGYLCGIIRGDGLLRSYDCRRARGGRYSGYRFRLALADLEALRRARGFLASVDVATSERVFQRAAVGRREMTAISAQAASSFERISAWSSGRCFPACSGAGDSWPGSSTPRGHEAISRCGSRTPIRRSSRGPRRARAGSGSTWPSTGHATRTGSSTSVSAAACPSTCGSSTSPIRRSRASATSRARWSRRSRTCGWLRSSRLGATLPLYDITTGTGDFIANGVVSHNCFARPTHKYLDFNAGRDFEREIVVKVNAPELLRAELARPSWKREHVALGTNTDPYQWVEGRYKLMPRHLGGDARRGAIPARC